MGRSSGGMTGTTSRIIHSGLLPLVRKASTTSRRLMMRWRFWPSLSRRVSRSESSLSSARSSSASASRSMSQSISRTASAPMPTRNSQPFSCACCFFI